MSKKTMKKYIYTEKIGIEAVEYIKTLGLNAKLIRNLTFHNSDILECKTGLFSIEYEEEPKSITVKIEYENVGDSNLTFTVEKITNFIGSFFQIKNLKVTEVKND